MRNAMSLKGLTIISPILTHIWVGNRSPYNQLQLFVPIYILELKVRLYAGRFYRIKLNISFIQLYCQRVVAHPMPPYNLYGFLGTVTIKVHYACIYLSSIVRFVWRNRKINFILLHLFGKKRSMAYPFNILVLAHKMVRYARMMS